METTFFHDTRFIYNGKDYYTRGSLNQEKFNEYKKYFGNITVVSRQENLKDSNISCIVSKNKLQGINFITVNSKYKGVIKKVKEQVRNTDFAIVRLPSFIGITALHYLKKYNKKYIIEMVGCAFDAFWNYGNIQGKMVAPIMYILNRYYIKNADNVLYVSNEFLQKRYPNKKNSIGCSDVNISISSEQNLRKRLEKIENRKKNSIVKIGLIGSLNVKYKGHKTAIKALSKLKDKYNIELHFLGAGDKENFEKIIKKYNVEKNVIFDGTLPSGQEVYKWMDGIDIYIIPSLTEGMPRALIEAMSRGCPCIGTDVGGITEILPKEMLINKKDYKQLVEKIINLLNDKEKIKKYATLNFLKAQQFEYEKLKKKKEKFYYEILKEVNNEKGITHCK